MARATTRRKREMNLRAVFRVLVLLAFVRSGSPGDAGIPADPEKTLERVQNGRIRVGLVENPPWVAREDGDDIPVGIEGDLVQQLVKELGAVPE